MSWLVRLPRGILTILYVQLVVYGSPPRSHDPTTEVDFVIVGGGTAGCVVARRLLEANKAWTVLIIEAGYDASSDPQVSDPQQFGSLIYSTKVTWNDFTQRSVNPKAPFQPLYLGMGKTLGGGSEVNALGYQRGDQNTFNEWAELVGDDQWSFSKLLPYFKKLENTSFAMDDQENRGSGGPLNVITGPTNFFQQLWEETGSSLGFPVVLDVNGVFNPFGFGMEQYTIAEDGSRLGTNEGYLQPVLNSSNLLVSTNSFATKLVLDRSATRVTGVSYLDNGVQKIARAKKEVVLSAGALRSPALLMLSGIGGDAVGQNLQDHPGLTLGWSHNISTSDMYPLNHPCAFINTSVAVPVNSSLLADMLVSLTFRPYPSHQLQVKLFLVRNNLRGSVTLNNLNPLDPPIVDMDYFADNSAVDQLVSAIRQVRTIFESEPLNSVILNEVAPGSQYQTDDQLRSWVINNVYSNYHLSGSCRMGSYSDRNNSVVDSDLRVFGWKGIRVVDTSIVPIIPSGTPYNTAVMLGEKGADLLISFWNNCSI